MGMTAHEKRNVSIPGTHKQQRKLGMNNNKCPLILTTMNNDPLQHETGMTTHEQQQLHTLKTPEW